MKIARTPTLVPLVLGTTLVAVTALAAPAIAVEPGSDYGRHVVHCAQVMGFSGDHNPGVHHQGFAGWPGAHEC